MKTTVRLFCALLALTLLLTCLGACGEGDAQTADAASDRSASRTSSAPAGADPATSAAGDASSDEQRPDVSAASASSQAAPISSASSSASAASPAPARPLTPAVALKAGDKVTFGHFEQDNNEGNGKEAIEWEVLDVNGEYALLLSANVLAFRTFYYDSYAGVTWETCSLRGWLNDNFLSDAFSADERSQIRTTRLVNGNNSAGVLGGNDTSDKVFVLTVDDVNKYLPTVEKRRARASETVRRGNWKLDDLDYVWWWLRTPGLGTKGKTTNAFATVPGEVNDMGELVSSCSGVRPALWARLTSKTVSARVPAAAKSDPLKGVKAGDTVSFGLTANQTVTPAPDVPIRWKVLAVENGRALLLSEAVLLADAMYGFEPYKGTYTTWSNSILRSTMDNVWKSSFTTAEAARIADTGNGVSHDGKPVVDKLFALSNQEVQTYLPTEASRKARDLKGNAAAWWLRGGTAQGSYDFIDAAGALAGEEKCSLRHGLRPAMWVTLN